MYQKVTLVFNINVFLYIENFNILKITQGLAYKAYDINDGRQEKWLKLEWLIHCYIIDPVIDEFD